MRVAGLRLPALWVRNSISNKGGPATGTLPGVFASPGGLPIMADRKVIGGGGVSGATGDQDEQCSKAGLGIK